MTLQSRDCNCSCRGCMRQPSCSLWSKCNVWGLLDVRNVSAKQQAGNAVAATRVACGKLAVALTQLMQ